MNSYRQNNDDAHRARRRLFAATILVVFLFLANLVSDNALAHAARAVASSAWQVGAGFGSRIGGSGFLSSRGQLESEVAVLQQQVESLQGQSAAFSATKAQNQQLAALVHLAQTSVGVAAPVISSFSASPYGTFEIGAGTADDVSNGGLVSTSDGFVVGEVADASAHQSLVTELFAPAATLQVLVDNIPLALHGEGGGNADAQAPRGASIAVGDPAFAPSLGGKSVGIVGNVQGGPADASTQVLVRVPADLASLQYVYVETSH